MPTPLDTINAFQTEYGTLWISNDLRLVQFDGAPDDAKAAWDQFCRHVLHLLANPALQKKISWLERVHRFFGGW